MKNILNGFYNIKYKIRNLEDAIIRKELNEEFQDELYDIKIALEYINEMIKEYEGKGKGTI